MTINFSTVDALANLYGNQNPGSSLKVLAAREVVRTNQKYGDAADKIVDEMIEGIFNRIAGLYTPLVLAEQNNKIFQLLTLSEDEIGSLSFGAIKDNQPLAEEYAMLLPAFGKSYVMRRIAEINREKRNLPEFLRLIAIAEKAAFLISDNKDQSKALCEIIDAHRRADNRAGAVRIARLIPDDAERDLALMELDEIE